MAEDKTPIGHDRETRLRADGRPEPPLARDGGPRSTAPDGAGRAGRPAPRIPQTPQTQQAGQTGPERPGLRAPQGRSSAPASRPPQTRDGRSMPRGPQNGGVGPTPPAHPGSKARRPLNFWQTLVLVLVMLIVAGLLGARPLHAAARNIDSGALRALALVVTTPLDAISGVLRLDKPYEWVRGEIEEVVTTEPSATTETTGGQSGSTTTTDGSTTTATTGTVTSQGPSTTVARPVFTEQYPLRVFLAGDSLMIEVGHAFTRASEALKSLDLYRINKVSSGFSNPEFYDWPKQLRDVVAKFDPVVTVMMFGGNEKVPITLDDGTKVQPFSDEWKAEYVKRVKAGLKIVTDSGSIVYWIGIPIMRSDTFAETARTLNSMYEQICDEDPLVFYVDGYELFSDGEGRYSAYLPDSSGEMQLVRADDGIHFTPAGGDRVVKAVLEMLSKGFDVR